MALPAATKVGFVFFVGICLLILFTVLLTDVNFFKKYYTVDVLFDSVGGLERGDKVTLGGMEVGEVKSLTLEENRIRVRLSIRTENAVARTSRFRVGDIGLLGGKRVDISWGEETDVFLRPGAVVMGESAPGLSEAIAGLGESSQKVEEILASTKQIADKLAKGEGTIGKLINDASLYNELNEAAPRLKKTLENLEEITAKINRGEGTVGKLVNDEEIYGEARETLVSAKTASQKLTDMVSKAERVRFFIGAETAYNIDTKRYLTKAFLQIDPTPSKLYRVGISVLTGPGTEAEVKDDPSTELDLQIGFRFFDERLTLRAGMLEGRIGGGIDYLIWPERLAATVEGRSVWTKDKDEGIEPFLLRARLTADLFWGFYAHAGGDNLLDHPAFNCGVGLKLEDDDIKALFGVVTLTQ